MQPTSTSELSLLDPAPMPELPRGEVEVPGKPTPWRRSGYNRKTGQHFTRPADTVARDTIAWCWKRDTGNLHFGSDHVELEVEAVFERPRSHFGSGRNVHLVKASAPRFPGKNCGDLDNLIKGVKDALTGVAYNDDSQVSSYAATCKRWAVAGEHAHMRIALRAL